MSETIELYEHLSVDVEDDRVVFNRQRDTVNITGEDFERVVEAYLRQRREARESDE